ncbi:ATP-binding protein [Streptomyces tendae]|uniref:ATP-binding protein n=1 Tax=Streptomyces tendae TaxID=1932 RepID=UPI00379B8197
MTRGEVAFREHGHGRSAAAGGGRAGSGVLADRLDLARRQYFVGRQDELALFRRALRGEANAPTVLVIHGPGGIGKSALLQRFGAEAHDAGRPVVGIKGEAIDPCPAAFEEATADVFSQDRAVLLVDGFEHCRDLEEWVRTRFLPRVPTGTLVVLAGRFAPDPVWRADLAWREVLRVIPLPELDPGSAGDLLSSLGVASPLHADILGFAAGHPLALRLAAGATAHHGLDQDASQAPFHAVSGRLLSRVVGEPPSPAHRRALEVCGHVAHTTEEVLRLVHPQEDSHELFVWLRRSSFVKASAEGLYPYGIVRTALDHEFRWRDPERYMDMHRALRRHFVERIRVAPREAALRAAQEYTHIISGAHWIQRFRGGHDEDGVQEEPLRPRDAPALISMAREAQGESGARGIGYWLERRPEAFHVLRSHGTGELRGFVAWLRIDRLDDAIRAADPVAAEAWEAVGSVVPLDRRGHLGLARFVVEGTGHRPSRSLDLVHARIVFEALRAKNEACSCVVTGAPDFWAPLMRYLGMFRPPRPVPAVHRADWQYGLFCHDWQAVGMEEWIEGIDARLLGGRPDGTTAQRGPDVPSVSREESDAAVLDALRRWTVPGGLADNPLLGSRLVEEHSTGDPAASLRELIEKAVRQLSGHPGSRHLYDVLTMTYDSTSTQRAVARKLDMSFSTYRRNLTRAVDEVRDSVWDWELRARARIAQGAFRVARPSVDDRSATTGRSRPTTGPGEPWP